MTGLTNALLFGGGFENLGLNARIQALENNDTIFQIFEYIGVNTSGTVTIPTEATVFDLYGDGIMDAYVVEADANQTPTETPSVNASAGIVQVTSLDNTGAYVLDSAPVDNACILYFIQIKDAYKSNVSLNSIVSPGIPLSQNPFGIITVAKSNADFDNIKDALDFANANATATQRYEVQATGYFIEPSLTVSDYVLLRGFEAFIAPSDQNNPLITIGSNAEVWGIRCSGPTNSYTFYSDAPNSFLKNSSLRSGGLHGVYIGPSSNLIMRDCSILGKTGRAIDVNGGSPIVINVAAASVHTMLYGNNSSLIKASNLSSLGGVTIDMHQADADSIFTIITADMSEDRLMITNAANLRLSYNSDKEGDERVHNIQEFGVGMPEQGFESIFGEGDSYTRGMLVYTETELGVFADVSEAARSASASTFTFPGLTADNAIYVSSDLEKSTGEKLTFFGFKTKVSAAMDIGTGDFVIEYYNAVNGWTSANYMETQSDDRFYQYAKAAFQHTGSFHIRGPIQLQVDEDANTRWDISDPISSGTNRYWIRIRLTETITTAPIFEQFKIHTNRAELNSDGWKEHFGSARPEGLLPLTIGNGRELAGSIGARNLWVNENTGGGYLNNRLTLTNQYFGWVAAVPDDLDTSSGITLKIAGRSDSAQTVELQVFYDIVTQGDLMYITDPGLLPGRRIASDGPRLLGSGETEFFNFQLNISDARARKDPADGTEEPDILFITLNPVTLPSELALAYAEAKYYKWCEGGHI